MLKLLIAVSLIFISPNLFSASCKGEKKSYCDRSNACYWVKKSTRKDGAKVKAHCRTKPGKATASSKKSKTKKKAKLKKRAKKNKKAKLKKNTKTKRKAKKSSKKNSKKL